MATVKAHITGTEVNKILKKSKNASFELKGNGKVELVVKTDSVARRVMKSVGQWGFNAFSVGAVLSAVALKGLVALGVVAVTLVSWPAVLIVLATAVTCVAIFAICEVVDAYRFGNNNVESHRFEVEDLSHCNKAQRERLVASMDVKKYRVAEKNGKHNTEFAATLSAHEASRVLEEAGSVEMGKTDAGMPFLALKRKGYFDVVASDVKKMTRIAMMTGPLMLLAVPITALATGIISGLGRLGRVFDGQSGAALDRYYFDLPSGNNKIEKDAINELQSAINSGKAKIRGSSSGQLVVEISGVKQAFSLENGKIPTTIGAGLTIAKALNKNISSKDMWDFAINYYLAVPVRVGAGPLVVDAFVDITAHAQTSGLSAKKRMMLALQIANAYFTQIPGGKSKVDPIPTSVVNFYLENQSNSKGTTGWRVAVAVGRKPWGPREIMKQALDAHRHFTPQGPVGQPPSYPFSQRRAQFDPALSMSSGQSSSSDSDSSTGVVSQSPVAATLRASGAVGSRSEYSARAKEPRRRPGTKGRRRAKGAPAPSLASTRAVADVLDLPATQGATGTRQKKPVRGKGGASLGARSRKGSGGSHRSSTAWGSAGVVKGGLPEAPFGSGATSGVGKGPNKAGRGSPTGSSSRKVAPAPRSRSGRPTSPSSAEGSMTKRSSNTVYSKTAYSGARRREAALKERTSDEIRGALRGAAYYVLEQSENSEYEAKCLPSGGGDSFPSTAAFMLVPMNTSGAHVAKYYDKDGNLVGDDL